MEKLKLIQTMICPQKKSQILIRNCFFFLKKVFRNIFCINYLKNNDNKTFKEGFNSAKNTIKILDFNVKIVISKLVEKFLVKYLDDVLRPIIVILLEISGYVNYFIR